jgi:prepilin-type processing-associated H-X9-DG protein
MTAKSRPTGERGLTLIETGQNLVYADGHARFLKPYLLAADREERGKASRRGYYPRAKLD